MKFKFWISTNCDYSGERMTEFICFTEDKEYAMSQAVQNYCDKNYYDDSLYELDDEFDVWITVVDPEQIEQLSEAKGLKCGSDDYWEFVNSFWTKFIVNVESRPIFHVNKPRR